MKLVDITIKRVIPDLRDPVEWSEDERALVNAWLERMAADFMLQMLGCCGPTKLWIDANGQIQIEPVDPLEAPSGAHPAAAPDGAKSGEGRADIARVFSHWPLAYCGY